MEILILAQEIICFSSWNKAQKVGDVESLEAVSFERISHLKIAFAFAIVDVTS